MKEIKANVIHLKNFSRDVNGLENVIYATDSQIAALVKMRNDPEKRYNFVKVGSILFSPMDVARIDTQIKARYEYPQYFLDRHRKESTGLITTN